MKNYRVIVHYENAKDYIIEAESADKAEEEAARRFTQEHGELDWVENAVELENAVEITSPVKSTAPDPVALTSVPSMREALIDCLRSMEMQEKRETGDFHISQPNALAIWNKSKEQARVALRATSDTTVTAHDARGETCECKSCQDRGSDTGP
jgi:methionyl-tRNA formyltransferase